MPVNTYGDISSRTAAKASKQLLTRALPLLVLENFGQTRPIGKNETQTVKFRRFEALDPTPNALVEGVTPSGKSLVTTDYTAQLTQFGDFVTITDVVQDTHEDPVLSEVVDILSEQQPQMIELDRYGTLKACTNRYYANGANRASVNSKLTLNLQRKITRGLKRQNAKKITKRLSASPNYSTEPVDAAFVAIAHSDCETDIRSLPGFVPTEKYGTMKPFEGEIGKVEDCRYILTTLNVPYASAGATGGTNVLETNATNADVYPIIYLAKDAYGCVPMKGKGGTHIMVVNPKPVESDPLGQRGHAGWKMYHTAVILNDLWMAVAEVAVSDLE